MANAQQIKKRGGIAVAVGVSAMELSSIVLKSSVPVGVTVFALGLIITCVGFFKIMEARKIQRQAIANPAPVTDTPGQSPIGIPGAP